MLVAPALPPYRVSPSTVHRFSCAPPIVASARMHADAFALPWENPDVGAMTAPGSSVPEMPDPVPGVNVPPPEPPPPCVAPGPGA